MCVECSMRYVFQHFRQVRFEWMGIHGVGCFRPVVPLGSYSGVNSGYVLISDQVDFQVSRVTDFR